MSQPLILRMITQEQGERLRREPESVEHFVTGPPGIARYERSHYRLRKDLNWLDRLIGLFKQEHLYEAVPDPPPPMLYTYLWGSHEEINRLPPAPDWDAPDPKELLDLDMAYEGLHYALSGEDMSHEVKGPLGALDGGGEYVGGESSGQALWVLWPPEVKALNEELQKIDETELRRRCDPERRAALGHPPASESETDIDYLLGHLNNLKEFAARAMEKEKAILFYIIV